MWNLLLESIFFNSSFWMLLLDLSILSIGYNLTWQGYDYQNEAKDIDKTPDYDPKKRLGIPDGLPVKTADELKERKCISINNYWYDVENFWQNHPGGDIILRFVNQEATSFFYGMHRHPEKVLRMFKPVAINPEKPPSHGLLKDVLKLYQRYYDKGIFIPRKDFLVRILILNSISFGLTCYTIQNYPENSICNGLMMGILIFISAGFTHDAGHVLLTYTKKWDDWLLWLASNVCFGVNGLWWRYEHDLHHGVPLTFDEKTGSMDV